MNNTTDELRTFILDNFLFSQADGRLSEDTSFLENGIIDSTGLLELIAFIERAYGIRLEDDELIPDNLDSLRKIRHFIDRKVQFAVQEEHV